MDDPLWIGLCIWFGFVFVGIILWLTIGELLDRRHAKAVVEKFDAFVSQQQPLQLPYRKSGDSHDEPERADA